MKYIVLLIVSIIIFMTVYIWSLEKNQSKISKGKTIDLDKNQNTALLIIDMQNDLTSPRGKMVLDTSQTNKMFDKMNEAIQYAEKNNWTVIYIQNEYKKNWVFNKLTNNAMLCQSEGILLDDRLFKIKKGIYLKKHIRDAFSNTKLDSVLSENHIGELYITGIDGKYCVNSTIKGALNRNYQIKIIKDLVVTKDNSELSKLKTEWLSLGIKEVELK